MAFSINDKLKALAIVHVFETSRPFGDFAACVVLDDGAGVSYGINQFTHRSGSLLDVVTRYLDSGGQIGREVITAALPLLRSRSPRAITQLAANQTFKKALKAAAVTPEMKTAQQNVAFERYLLPALKICEARNFTSALSLAVVYDSVTHGSWEYISSRVIPTPVTRRGEREWITEYVRQRHRWLNGIRRLKVTSYRTRFFLEQIAIGNWDLKTPLTVHGVRLTDSMFLEKAAATTAVEPPAEPRRLPTLDDAQQSLVTAASTFDRVESVVTTVTSRKDAAKSLWATVAGTIGQAAWAVFGFVTGLPTEVWIVVAIIDAAFVLMYLYRQITLGKIRETSTAQI